MEIGLLVARLLLAAVFGMAGVAKLADRKSARQTFINFGVPEALAGHLAFLLPVIELLTALALILTATAWWGALIALALLALFMIGIGINLARGNTPDCNCFGQLHAAPIGWQTIARNLLLALVAGFILVQGKNSVGADIFSSWGATTRERISLLIGFVGLAGLLASLLLVRRLLKQQALLLQRIEALEEQIADDGIGATRREDAALPAQHLPIGAPAPDFSAVNLDGADITLDELLATKKSLLLFFVAPTCTPCAALLPEIEQWQRQYAERLNVVLISKGATKENIAKFANREVHDVLLQNDSEISEAYAAKWTPGALLVTADGAIGSHIAYGSEEIKRLMGHTIDQSGKPWLSMTAAAAATATTAAEQGSIERLQIGDNVPSLMLAEASGKMVDLLDQLGGRKTLVLFWNPGCGFCQQMVDEVRMLEGRPPNAQPQILLIASGTAEDNLRMDLQSPILLDEDSAVSKRFGSTGTPTALLIDETGTIVSALGVGKAEVLALAGFKSARVGE